ncbi:MAG: diguanylate cyclase [Arcobacter sp.]|uniref:GGDEF domain-containing response regulator n=1 Tax=Arcobacter sp. TaxID=1872629 RepID=UPI003B00DCF4
MSKAILCVDDEQIVLSSLKTQLGTFFGTDYDIEVAQSAEDALEIIDELKNDGIELELIVSDFLMPGMKGDEFLIKAQTLLPKTKKLLLTGQANLDGVANIVNNGALYRYISKPWEQTDLVMTIKEALKSYTTEKDLEFYMKNLEELVEIKTLENKSYLEIVDKYLIASKTDLKGNITEVSKAFCEISGYTKEELIGKNHNIVRHPDMKSETYKNLWKTIKKGQAWEGEIKNLKKDGDFYWVKARVSANYDKDGNIIGYASIRVDITDKKAVEVLSVTDHLTELYNRRFFNETFEKEIQRAKRYNKNLGFIIFDVDYFKQYNDYYGHQKGDTVLSSLSQTLNNQLNRASDYAFRLGGEEFGVLITDINLEGLTLLVKKIKDAIEELNIAHSKSSISEHITASFGACLFESKENITQEKIFKFTDDLLYQAKDSGRNNFIVKEYLEVN